MKIIAVSKVVFRKVKQCPAVLLSLSAGEERIGDEQQLITSDEMYDKLIDSCIDRKMTLEQIIEEAADAVIGSAHIPDAPSLGPVPLQDDDPPSEHQEA